ncbi:hypothetical protein H8959_013456, partial [Pygathrix nigripes]
METVTPATSHTAGGVQATVRSRYHPVASQRLEELFRRYKDEREDAILEEGMERFCNDLCVDPTEFR